jgi:hypothetical protein
MVKYLLHNSIFVPSLKYFKTMRILLLLCVIATISCKNTPTSFIKTFEGTVGNNPVSMELQSNNRNISGSYYYKNKGIPIKLKGETNALGKSTINEFYNNALTGTFSGNIEDGAFSGTWSNAEKTKTLEFLLIESSRQYMPKNEEKPIVETKPTALIDYYGKWKVFLECNQSSCSHSVVGERVAEVWNFKMIGDNKMEIDVDGSKHRVKRYSCYSYDRDNSVIEIESTNIGILSKYTTAKGRFEKSGNLSGKLIFDNGACSSEWTITARQEAPIVIFK